MLKETPVGAPIDRSQQRGSPALLLLITFVVVGGMLGFVYLDESQHALFLTLFLAGFAALGVLAAFLYAVGVLQWSGRAARNDLTKAIIDTAAEGHLVVDRQGRVLYANAAYQTLCGGVPGRVASIRPVERLLSGTPEVSEAVYRLAQAAREGRGATETMRLVPALAGGGASAWYRVRVRPLPRDGGSVQHWSVADITRERERNENEFQELQQAVSYLDNAPAGFLCARPDGRIVYLNATLADWLDLDIAEIADRELDLKDIVAGSGAALLAGIQGAPGGIRTETIDLDLKRRSGQTLPVRLVHRIAFAADGTAGVSRTLVLNRSEGQGDATDEGLRAAEVRFARFFHNSPLAIATLDRKGTIVSTNARFAALLQAAELAEPRMLAALATPADRPRIEAAFAEVLAGRGEIDPVDATLATREPRSARFFLVPAEAREADGEAALIYLIETTEEKKLQEQFIQSQKMNAIGQLAGGVAHDFNNHLQAIVGFADLLIGNYRATDPRYQDVMQIKSSANRAKSLVRQLLAFSRQQTLMPESIDLGAQLSDLTNLLKRSIGPNVELDVRHGRDLWPIHADPASFDNMIINLAVNARDAMPKGGRLVIRTANIPAADCAGFAVEGMPAADYVLVEVEDTGTGMTPDVKKKIFEPFFTTKDVGRGTGLGLSSVYGFVTQSNGFIDCQSEPGVGTTFRIFLPRHMPAADPPSPGGTLDPVPPAARPAPVADLTGRGTILLVEDEDAVRNFGARALRSRGYTVIEAQSGTDALEQVGDRIGEIDLVVSDVVMPEMDGPTLLKELRARNPDLKVIFVSGYAEEAFRKNLPDGEQFDFLPKPFGLKQLVEAVKGVMA
ncbi:cell cycle histidine kinase CckA [Rhabdaerophilum calidifontis]|uniref:cell cycle histidine kinase CckA n=1 Tax=Rhabdaerophilum calidifontis TaxID=2604328 RepID=UPI001238AC7F|nr:PAS domain-containing sensor histidine kinase [Rhabdaerophilum calidifontis]